MTPITNDLIPCLLAITIAAGGCVAIAIILHALDGRPRDETWNDRANGRRDSQDRAELKGTGHPSPYPCDDEWNVPPISHQQPNERTRP